jgi:hypothetical protein
MESNRSVMAKKVNKIKRRTSAKLQTKKGSQRNSKPSKPPVKKTAVRPAKVFVYALALAALGGGGFLVFDRIKKKRQASQNVPPANSADTIIINNSLPVSYNSSSSRGSRLISGSDSFPLKRGSRGQRVATLQQALSKSTPSIAVDGQFGPQTASALKSAGYSEVVDEQLFNRIIGANSAMVLVFNPSGIADTLYRATQAKDLAETLSALKQIKSVSDYSSVNEYYKKQTFISRTIVTDLLEYAFKYDESAKAQIKNEFLRMGLKVSASGTWSLQGIRLYKDLITIRETVVTDSQNNKIPVRRNTILGDEIEVANGMTWFKSIDNSILKVPTQDIKYT